MSIPKRLLVSDAASGKFTDFEIWVNDRAAAGYSASQMIDALIDHPDWMPHLEAYIILAVAIYSISASELVQ
jgi:hypothetical protein